jgi:hypothetical protein
MEQQEFDPGSVIGRHYEDGMLPYGGRFNCNGIITFAVSKKQFIEKMRRLESVR